MTTMRKTVAVALVTLLALAVAAIAESHGGHITAVDANAKTITCHSKAGADATFKTNDKTEIWVGPDKGSWSDLKVGALVKVISHAEGTDQVADKIEVLVMKSPS
jgi:hypothetical protein